MKITFQNNNRDVKQSSKICLSLKISLNRLFSTKNQYKLLCKNFFFKFKENFIFTNYKMAKRD